MIKEIFKSFVIFFIILGVFFSNIPFYAFSGLVDSYIKTRGVVDKIWLLEENHDSDIVDKFASIREVAEKLRIHNTMAAVANDAASESHTGTTGSINQASFTWTHTPVGTPRGVLVYVYTISATKKVTSVTYGGVAMTEITAGAAVDATTEPGRIDTFFLGSGIPTGAKSIIVSRTNDATIMYASAVTQTAGTNTEIYLPSIVLLQNNGTFAVQSVNDGSPGTNSIRYAAGYTGASTPVPAGTGSTLLNNIDFGSYGITTVRETTAGQGARNIGFNYTTSDDRAAVHLAVREISADTTPPTPDPMTFSSVPSNFSASQIDMTATTATDADSPPVNYYFTLDNSTCGANAGTGGASSAWQSGTSYSDTGLQPNKCYGYTVKARDSAGTPNETAASGISSAYTSANVPGTPTLDGATFSTLNLTNAENSNPASNPTTNFAAQVVTTSPSDATWLNQWIDASGNPSATAIWLTDTQLDALVLQGLQSSTLYGIKIKARNQNSDETALSAEGQGTTSAPAAVLTVSTSGNQTANLDSGSSNTHLGGAFTFSINTGSANVTGIKVSNNGTAGNLSDVRLYYDTDGTYSGTESCFNTTCTDGGGGTLGANIAGSLAMTSGNTYYIYIIADIAGTVAGGLTVDLQITNLSTDIATTATNSDTGAKNITGETTVRPNITGFSNSTEPALIDGGRETQTISISGAGFGIQCNIGLGSKISIGAYDLSCTGATFSNTTITIPLDAAIPDNNDGGTGASGLLVTIGNAADNIRQSFYIYARIASLSANSGQIGSAITVSGNHFGASAGSIIINTKAATVGAWGASSLTGVTIPGQEGAANYNNGTLQITRADTRTSNSYDPTGADFTIFAPSVSGSNPTSSMTGNTLTIEFSGLGIDTDTGTAPILKLTRAGQTDITGTSYLKITDYQTVSASFDLTGAATGYWKLVIVNMDAQSGSFGNETTTGFNILPPAPTVTGISPDFGNDSGVASITSITGTNFQSDATAKLTKTSQSDIPPSTAFTYTSSTTLSNGAFDLTGKTDGWWRVVVTNPDLQTASYGNEIDTGFEIRPSKPSTPTNIYQFKIDTDTAQPPTTNIAAGAGVGIQTNIYFRMDMEGGLTGELYYPQVEVKPIGTAFECNNASPTPCTVTSGFFAQGTGAMFNGTAVQGWVNINGIDGSLYHWQARVKNSGGASNWVSFGGNNDPDDLDVYLDNTPPSISPGTDGACDTAAINITDIGATIRWNTSDATSGAQTPPGSGTYATAQVQYIPTSQFTDWTSSPGTLSAINPRENSPHKITLSNLSPSVSYAYRIRSKDSADNEGFSSPNCTFDTISTRPIKTVEFFINQETGQNTGTRISKDFSVYIPESPSAEISVKSAFIEITGITSDTINQTINIELRRELGQTYASSGADYIIDSTGTTTPFTILFDVLNPPGTGQENMNNITTGATNYDYTLFLNGNGTAISAFSAKLVITYSYVL